MRRFRQLFIGILIGALIFSATPVTAAVQQFILTKSVYKVFVDGKEYADKTYPILTYKGITYVPLGKITSLLGGTYKVDAKEKSINLVSLKTIPTPSPTPVPTPTPTPKKEINTSITYETLARSADSYKGEIVKFTGKVIQSSIRSVISVYRIDIRRTGDTWDGTILLECSSKDVNINFLENDYIDFTGEILGYYTYTSVAGVSITIPDIKALSASLNTTIEQELRSKEQAQKDLERQKTLNYRAELERQHNQRINDLTAEKNYWSVRTSETARKNLIEINKQIDEENAEWQAQLTEWAIEDKQNGY